MAKGREVVTTEHHRRPKSIGGADHKANISYIQPSVHRDWHTLFGNMNAEQICNKINTLFKPKGVTVVCTFINGKEVEFRGDKSSKNRNKQNIAWARLSNGASFEKTIEYINNVLLDPSYHFYIVE